MIKKYIVTAFILLFISTNALANDLRFTLKNGQGKEVSETSWPGQYLIIAIGYTHCPDVCPTTLIDLTMAMKALGDKSNLVTPLFISIDPNRDSPEKLGIYTDYFHPKMEGLVGTHAQTQALAKSLKASFGYKVNGIPVTNPLPKNYDVYHSSYIYLYDDKQRLVDVFGYGTRGNVLAEKIKPYLE